MEFRDLKKQYRVLKKEIDAGVLDVMASGALRITTAGGELLWMQGYDLAVSSSVALSNETINRYEFGTNAYGQTVLQFPSVQAGKTGDFLLDVVNPALVSSASDWPSAYNAESAYSEGDIVSYDSKIWKCAADIETGEAWTKSHWEEAWPSFEFDGLADRFNIVTSKGEDLT